ncbi:MAG: phosphonate ABC transporter ATP-binding protein [Planctomycetota bacterium]|nr:phosphonate ABC transporter ATP-binding protein [Planctomycetota bacterium]
MAVDVPMLKIRGLRKVYPNGYEALKGIDLDVPKGSFIVCIGLSGAGKSTFIRCLNRLIEPTSGSVELEGEEITDVEGAELRYVRSRMAMIFQKFNLVNRASVLTNVMTGALRRYGTLPGLLGLWRKQDKEEALHFLDLVGLADLAPRRVDALSGGQQQRVAIARALMQHPRVILADEPVASLDPATSHSVMDYLKKLQEEQDITLIANLHFLSLAREYGNQVVALKGGAKVFEGTPHEITDQKFQEIYGEDAAEVEIR